MVPSYRAASAPRPLPRIGRSACTEPQANDPTRLAFETATRLDSSGLTTIIVVAACDLVWVGRNDRRRHLRPGGYGRGPRRHACTLGLRSGRGPYGILGGVFRRAGRALSGCRR